MITGLVIIVLFFTVIVLSAKLHEARYRASELRRQLEREAYSRVTLMALMTPCPGDRTEMERQ